MRPANIYRLATRDSPQTGPDERDLVRSNL
jgi:hypothetical protein